ncbi:MAG: sulfatase-like hydrolase/transferase [bacterium]|nr:sulfatase-like hydrolase/transferase [bacterium]
MDTLQQTRRGFLRSVGVGAAAVLGSRLLPAADDRTGDKKPNIIFIFADDMGFGDPKSFNDKSGISTPNIDRLGREGIRFLDAHAPASVCIPSRYGLLTGRYPFRTSIKWDNSRMIPAGRMTLASLLKKNGYHTGMVGKWHLGFADGKKVDYSKPMRGGPVDCGFDYYFGIPASLDIPPYYYVENDRCVSPPTERIETSHTDGVRRIQGAFWRGGGIAKGFRHDQVLPTFTKKAVKFIEDHQADAKNRNKPMFLYLPLAAPHTPWMPTGKFSGSSRVGMYGDFVTQVDNAVGQVLSALDRHKLTGNTLVIFTSDNGPVWYKEDVKRYKHSSAGPLRGMKGDAWEGGHHMPFVVRWPGRVKPATSSDEVICFTDMLATFAAIVGDRLPDDAGEDSYNILPAMLGQKYDKPIREATVTTARLMAVRQGRWKLILGLGSGGFSFPRSVKAKPGGPKGQLYDMKKDPGETTNVYKDNPDIVASLTSLLEKYKKQGRSTPLGNR